MALRYKVPQNVQREDTIIAFITLRQLIILLVTGGFSYLMYTQLSKSYELSQFEIFLIFIPLMLGAAFAFLRIGGLSLAKFLLILIEQTIFLPPRRFWQPGVAPLVSMTKEFATKKEKVKNKIEDKNVSAEKIQNLARVLDGEMIGSGSSLSSQ